MLEFFAYAVNTALIALGAVVTVHPGWVEQRKALIGGSMVALGVLALILTGIQSAHESAELKDALSKQSQLVGSNLELQKENLALSRENRDLSTKTLRAALGDPDKPPYLYFDFHLPEAPLRSQLYVKNSSREHAAHSVTVSLMLDGGVVVTSGGVSVPPANRVPANFPNKVGIQSNSMNLPQLENVGEQFVVVSIIASTIGSFQQVTGMIRSSEKTVLQAVRVSRLNDPSNLIFSTQDREFPADFVWPKQSAEKP